MLKFATLNKAAIECSASSFRSSPKRIKLPATRVPASMASIAGKIRRTRRSQKSAKVNFPASWSFRMMEVIRNPEITKNTSTPTNPPESQPRPRWKSTTGMTAKARRPSTSGRYFRALTCEAPAQAGARQPGVGSVCAGWISKRGNGCHHFARSTQNLSRRWYIQARQRHAFYLNPALDHAPRSSSNA